MVEPHEELEVREAQLERVTCPGCGGDKEYDVKLCDECSGFNRIKDYPDDDIEVPF